MKISEVFYSLQGEGTLTGVPSVFIRTSGCNLRCTWCDTPYTSWHPEYETRSVDAIAAQAKTYGAVHAVITGGEPMMHERTVELTERLRRLGFHITIETAGTLWQRLECDLMSISPKLGNSTPRERDGGRFAAQHERLRYQPDVLRRLTRHYPYQLKFVIAAPRDVLEAAAMVEAIEADPRRVVLMPEGVEAGVLRERSKWLAEVCLKHGYRFSPRLHVDIWGDERGR